MRYKIINSLESLTEFIEWLPELKPHERFYVALFARNKYTKVALPAQCQLARLTATKKTLIARIQELEIMEGMYKVKGVPVPNEALVLYILPNPRNLEMATKNATKEFLDLVTRKYNGYNPQRTLLTCIHKAKSYTKFVDFDFDVSCTVDKIKAYRSVLGFVNPEACTVIDTYGGFHLLVEPDKISKPYRKRWYQSIQNIQGCDNSGDLLLPIVGTTQGGFTPYFIDNTPSVGMDNETPTPLAC